MIVYPIARDMVEPFATYQSAFTDDECDTIISAVKQLGLQNSIVGTPGNETRFDVNEDVRVSGTRFLLPNETKYDTKWIFERLLEISMDANNKFFGFNLWGFAEGIQFTEYNAPTGKYDSHTDRVFNYMIRKLSMVVQLTDPNDYEGGDLEIFQSDTPEKMSRSRGSIILFPSYTLHRVTPVTKGTRHSLVAWMTGDQFQ